MATTTQLPTLDTVRSLSATELLALARKLRKNASDLPAPRGELRIALTGGGNLSYLGIALETYFRSAGFDLSLYVSPYDAYRMECSDPNSPLVQFKPDDVVILNHWREFIVDQPPLTDSGESVDRTLESIVRERLTQAEALRQRTGATIYITEIVTPNRRADGYFSLNRPGGLLTFLREINRRTRCSGKNFRFIDLDETASEIGKNAFFDDSAYFLSKQPFALAVLPTVANAVSAPILNDRGVVRKCLVLDLDHTLWGGVVGDDGLYGIRLDPNDAVGEAYLDFQRTVLAYQRRGVLLAVCSKNDEKIAKEVFQKNAYCLLKLKHFASFYANWEPKSENLKRIAAELNISTDALVFFDDNPVERDAVRNALPEVTVVNVPNDPALYSAALDQARLFDWTNLTGEDLARSESLRANRERAELESESNDYASYLASLKMTASLAPVTESERERFIQLFNKTNQFNLRTERISEEDFARMSETQGVHLLRVKLKDKFSDYGIISALILKESFEVELLSGRIVPMLEIEGWVMSCRVFNRGLETFILSRLREIARTLDARTIQAVFCPTEKNGYLAGIFPKLGFEAVETSGELIRYRLDLTRAPEPDTTIMNEALTI